MNDNINKENNSGTKNPLINANGDVDIYRNEEMIRMARELTERLRKDLKKIKKNVC